MNSRFFVLKNAPRPFSTKSVITYIHANYIQKQGNHTSSYYIAFLTVAVTLLLGVYSFAAYSFLETSSVPLYDEYSYNEPSMANVAIPIDSQYAYKFSLDGKNRVRYTSDTSVAIPNPFQDPIESIYNTRLLMSARSMLCQSQSYPKNNAKILSRRGFSTLINVRCKYSSKQLYILPTENFHWSTFQEFSMSNKLL